MTQYEKIISYIKTWENRCYPDGLPDEAPNELESRGLVPSYRRICKAILKNDVQLQTLGFSRPQCELYMQLKKRELTERGVKCYDEGQLDMFRRKM
jgi:Predicted phosphoadenosine phosphosulfate sulfotransferase